MTKLQKRFELARPLEARAEALAAAHAVYGIDRVTVDDGGGAVMVEYDATRMNVPQLRAALIRAGVLVKDS